VKGINWNRVQLIILEFIRINQDKIVFTIVKMFQAIIIIGISFLIIKFGSLTFRRFFERQKEFKYKLDIKRIDTLCALCISVLRYTVYFIAGVTILQSVFNINATTIITAAGVGGLAIGFGAQSLVKDVITGFFILLEDQFSVGDTITIDGMTGTVEEIGLRITKFRNFTGDLYILPNSEIKKVTNHTRGDKAAIVDVTVAYEEDVDKVLKILEKFCETCSKKFENIIEGPTVLGILNFGSSGVIIRIFAKTICGKQGEIEREIRKEVKKVFDAEGIKVS